MAKRLPREGSKRDMAEDKVMAKKRGMTLDQWERSPADRKHDAPKRKVPQRDGVAKYAREVKAI